jgi:hypothetical protein
MQRPIIYIFQFVFCFQYRPTDTTYGVIYKLQARNCYPSPKKEGFSRKAIQNLVFPRQQQSLVDQGLLIIKASRSPSDTHSVGLLWTSDQPDAEPLPDNTQHSQETDVHATDGIRTRSHSKRAVADWRLKRRIHCKLNCAV